MKTVFRRSFEEKKEYLAKIGSQLFYKRGYKTTSLEDIAQKGKVSKAGIYHYFKTKEDILSYILIKDVVPKLRD